MLRRPSSRTVAASMLLLLAAPLASAADSVVIYRCTDARGALTIQNDVACPAGTRQERTVVESPLPPTPTAVVAAPPPFPPPAPPVRTPPPSKTPPAEIVERGPPPELFQCRTWDDTRYLTDDSVPIERCAPLQTVGIGGAQGIGAGAACEMVVDTCQKVAEEALCDSWNRRVRDAEAVLRFGRYDNRRAAEADIERVTRIARESSCAR